jgi:CcmD family protein
MIKNLIGTALVILFLGFLPSLLQAQSGLPDPETIAGQNLRGYTHVFMAYAIAWVLILGWVISIARRLGRVEKALQE